MTHESLVKAGSQSCRRFTTCEFGRTDPRLIHHGRIHVRVAPPPLRIVGRACLPSSHLVSDDYLRSELEHMTQGQPDFSQRSSSRAPTSRSARTVLTAFLISSDWNCKSKATFGTLPSAVTKIADASDALRFSSLR